MLTAQVASEGQIKVVETTRPELPPLGGLLRVRGCGLCGSDLDKLLNQKATPGMVLGHEVVGTLEALSPGHESPFQVGDRLVAAHHVPCGQCHYCLNNSQSMCRHFKTTNFIPGGFSQQLALTQGHLHHTAFKVPDGISDAEASCVEPLACVLRAMERGGSYTNGSVAVIGLGFIGLMASQLYQQRGHQVFGLDLSPERLAFAQREGFVDQSISALEAPETMQAIVSERTAVGRVDLVFLTVVNSKTLAQALVLVRDGGTLVLFTSASPGTLLDPTPLYFREINVVTSYSPSLASLQEAARVVFERQIRLQPLITHHLPLSAIEDAVALYRSGQAMKVFIQVTDVAAEGRFS